jgi:hypothetical protein
MSPLRALPRCQPTEGTDENLLSEPTSVSADRWHFVIPLRPSACLLRDVSWLLVAFVPGLLMLATFGLDRLEAGLDDDAVSAVDVNAVLEQAKADCAKPALRPDDVATYELLDDGPASWYSGRTGADSPPALPTRVFVYQESNPEFRPTRQANPV